MRPLRFVDILGRMKKFLIAMCYIATLFNGIGTTLGICVAAQVKTMPGYAFNTVGALMILALVLSTSDVWRRRDSFHRNLRIFWFLALAVNLIAVFLAGLNHVILQNPLSVATDFDWNKVKASSLIQLLTVAILTIFLTGAPVALSFQWRQFFDDDSDEDEHEHVKTPVGASRGPDRRN